MKLLMYLLGALVVCGGAWASDSSALALRLAVTLNSDRSIDCELSVKNTTGSVLEISISDANPPFSVHIIDQSGHDLNEAANRPIKDRTRRGLISVRLQAGEVRTFHARVAIPGAMNADASSGSYSVQAQLATVDYIDRQYVTKLFTSNAVPIHVGR